ncbi:hypothetical protein R2APBS1_1658 [Rhodanobacter denitrificans]|uniref:Uncharacterized protein n=2 Tax=Rhodanobacter denitrificans TaxID=666685 RepID=M4NDF1_9GAMM|nr:hypothetical protein R2APBS1_1658 [Rhodanobacter denitrificans]
MPEPLFSIKHEDGRDMSDELNAFARTIGLERIAPGRYSILLVLSLFGGMASGRMNPAVVVQEIEALEGLRTSRFKKPIQNKHPPLQGLWHKHFYDAGLKSLAMNFKKGLDKFKIPLFLQRMKEAREAGVERYVTLEDVDALATDMVQGNLARLAERQAMSGEWLMFAEHEGRRYYLCLATHDSSQHDGIRTQIDEICCKEFPFLKTILNDLETRP